MSALPWFRMYREILDDHKISTLKNSQFRLYFEILCVACEANLAGNLGMCADVLSWRLRKKVKKDLQELINRNLISQDSDGMISVNDWEKRQFSSDTSKDRTKKWRERRSQLPSQDRHRDVTVTSQEQSRNSHCDVIDTDTDTEQNRKDTEQKKNKPPSPAVLEVFDFWVSTMGKNSSTTKLCASRTKKIKAALDLGFTVEQLKNAITGCTFSDWHMGRSPNNKKKQNRLTTILRDSDQIESFIEDYKNKYAIDDDDMPVYVDIHKWDGAI